MSRQMSFEEMLPEKFKGAVRRFSDGEFLNRSEAAVLPGIRNRHEAYGYLTECHVGLSGAMAAIKTAMTDATKLLVAPDDAAFVDTVQVVYSAALDTAIAAINMAVQAQNITHELLENAQNQPPTPLEEMAQGGPALDDADLIGEEADAEPV